MSAFRKMVAGCALGCVLLTSGAAFADDGVPIKITNDGTTDILVTVYDMNTVPHRVVVSGQRINGFSTVPVSVTAGPDGMGHVSWTATSVDHDTRLCGHANALTLGNDALVHVHADTACSET
jgi:hypothetical protein